MVPRPVKPVPPSDKADAVAVADHDIDLSIFAKDVKEYVKRRNILGGNIKKLCSVIWIKGFDAIEDNKNSANLVREAKGISYEYDGHPNPYLVLNNAKTKYYKYFQKENNTNLLHFNTFRALAEVVEHHGRNIRNDNALVDLEIKKISPGEDIDSIGDEKLTLFRAISRSKALAIGFVKRSDHARYGELIGSLENQYSSGTDQYPTDLPKALSTIDYYVRGRTTPRNPRHPPPSNDNHEIEMNFVQADPPTPGIDGVTFDIIACFGCQSKGHYKDKCPTSSSPNIQMLQFNEEPDGSDSIVDPDSSPDDFLESDSEEVADEANEKDDVFHSFGFLQKRPIQTTQT